MEAHEDTLAYDGSHNPQKRALTARERDILCRMIRDVLSFYPAYIVDTSELSILKEVFTVLDPRN